MQEHLLQEQVQEHVLQEHLLQEQLQQHVLQEHVQEHMLQEHPCLVVAGISHAISHSSLHQQDMLLQLRYDTARYTINQSPSCSSCSSMLVMLVTTHLSSTSYLRLYVYILYIYIYVCIYLWFYFCI